MLQTVYYTAQLLLTIIMIQIYRELLVGMIIISLGILIHFNILVEL